MAKNRIEQEILIKVTGGKELDALDKQIKDLIKQKAKIQVDADTTDAEKKLEELDKQLADLREEKAKIVVDAKVDAALAALDEVAAEAKNAEAAAEALSVALGPELAAKANVDDIVADFRNMGLTMDDIVANADRLGGKLKEVADADPGGNLDASFRRAKGGVDDLGKSADSSKSVLANMVGNSVQDLGALSGVAGGAGVAIGQMGEYMADARASGEKFGSIIKNFAGMALPIAGIATAVQLVGKYMKSVADTKAFEKKRVEDFAAALEDAVLSAEELQDVLSEGGDNKILQRIGSETRDVDQSVGHLFGTLQDFNEAVRKGQPGYDAWADSLLATAEASGTTGRRLELLKFLLDEASDGAITNAQASLAQSEGMNTIVEAAVAYASAIKGTSEGTKDAAFNNLFYAETTDDAADSQTGFGDKLKATWDKLGRVNERQREAAEAADDWAVALAGAQDEVNELADVFSQMEIREGVLSSIFELGNAPLDALGEIRDVEDGLRDLGDFIKEEGVPNIFSGSDIDAGPFLDKIAGLRGPIQEQITAAFAGGGDWRAVADQWVDKLYYALGGKVSKGNIEQLLGLGDLEAQIDVALKQSAVESVKRQLEILVGLQGDNPWTASIELALDAGAISPEAAEILVQAQLEGAGVLIPSALDTPDTAKAKREADEWLALPGNAARFRSTMTKPTNTAAVRGQAQGDLTRLGPVELRVALRGPTVRGAGGLVYYNTADGGTPSMPPPGGIVAERRPEIINDKYLVTQPTLVPAGTRVTSGARTARILRTRGPGGFRQYDNGGTVVAGPRTINVNVNAAVVGNRFDVDRQVARSMHRIERLMGSRG